MLLQIRTKTYLKKYTELWDKIKNRIEAINGGKPIKYKRDFMKVKFKSNDVFSLDKILSFSNIIVVGSVIKKDKKYYPQVYLHECLYQFVNEL